MPNESSPPLKPPIVTLIGIVGLPEISPGHDLAALIAEAAQSQGTPLQNKDVLVITQKVVSKAEGRIVNLDDVEPSRFAKTFAQEWDKDPRHIEVILQESHRIVRMEKGVLITETRHGIRCANAGVDASNLPESNTVSLLPVNPDESACTLRKDVWKHTGAEVAVIISDTFGRPWREGATNVAIGVAGLLPLRDYRNQQDAYGTQLRTTMIAIADELASAAELVTNKTTNIPTAIIRGYPYPSGEGRATQLLRGADTDLFR